MTDLEQQLTTTLDVLTELKDGYAGSENLDNEVAALTISAEIVMALLQQCTE